MKRVKILIENNSRLKTRSDKKWKKRKIQIKTIVFLRKNVVSTQITSHQHLIVHAHLMKKCLVNNKEESLILRFSLHFATLCLQLYKKESSDVQ